MPRAGTLGTAVLLLAACSSTATTKSAKAGSSTTSATPSAVVAPTTTEPRSATSAASRSSQPEATRSPPAPSPPAPSPPAPSPSPTLQPVTPTQVKEPVPSSQPGLLPQGSSPFDINPADFTSIVTNPYFPLTPGRRMTYKETAADGTQTQAVIIVLDQTKKIANGVLARVVRDTVTGNGKVVEDTFDWFAQDRDGNVWYFGEQTAEFDNGTVTGTQGSFEAGVGGALAGVAVPAHPQQGMTYRQEYYQDQAQDNGEVLSTEEFAQVPAGLFRDVLLTRDSTPLEPDLLEYKLYAKGVGAVLILHASGGGGRDELISVDTAPAGAGTGPLGKP
jgi:hypothetical protein